MTTERVFSEDRREHANISAARGAPNSSRTPRASHPCVTPEERREYRGIRVKKYDKGRDEVPRGSPPDEAHGGPLGGLPQHPRLRRVRHELRAADDPAVPAARRGQEGRPGRGRRRQERQAAGRQGEGEARLVVRPGRGGDALLVQPRGLLGLVPLVVVPGRPRPGRGVQHEAGRVGQAYRPRGQRAVRHGDGEAEPGRGGDEEAPRRGGEGEGAAGGGGRGRAGGGGGHLGEEEEAAASEGAVPVGRLRDVRVAVDGAVRREGRPEPDAGDARGGAEVVPRGEGRRGRGRRRGTDPERQAPARGDTEASPVDEQALPLRVVRRFDRPVEPLRQPLEAPRAERSDGTGAHTPAVPLPVQRHRVRPLAVVGQPPPLDDGAPPPGDRPDTDPQRAMRAVNANLGEYAATTDAGVDFLPRLWTTLDDVFDGGLQDASCYTYAPGGGGGDDPLEFLTVSMASDVDGGAGYRPDDSLLCAGSDRIVSDERQPSSDPARVSYDGPGTRAADYPLTSSSSHGRPRGGGMCEHEGYGSVYDDEGGYGENDVVFDEARRSNDDGGGIVDASGRALSSLSREERGTVYVEEDEDVYDVCVEMGEDDEHHEGDGVDFDTGNLSAPSQQVA
ncbi:hypothetical protein THAOC_06867 [Thalassiosira oceanica]|uniref:Uncharacterized protein n=1 Tax=Thalassiosira oceanica TaxID=159749 RepID=K0SZA6_THAOC|nr:hypothetical protein THAOC_06867 [Thalassiosira oceanica]|eukprot:EJK71673.1 hypothetical protein THAOC_06867 [Thalassiosira oceanica]